MQLSNRMIGPVAALLLIGSGGAMAQGTEQATAQATTQGWAPTRAINMIIPFSPGGGTDIIGRALAEGMSKALKQPVQVLNQDGGVNTAGMTTVANADANGYHIAFTPLTPVTQAPYTVKGLPYRFESFDYVCWIYDSVFAIAVHKDSPYKTWNDLLTASRGGKPLTYGFAGAGSVPHLQVADAAVPLKMNLSAVPYRGAAPAATAVLSKSIDFANISLGSFASQDLRALLIFSDERDRNYPDVPTAKDVGIPDPVPSANVGVLVKKGTPPEIRAALENACKAAVNDETLQKVAKAQSTALFFKDGKAFQTASEIAYKRMGAVLTKLDMLAK